MLEVKNQKIPLAALFVCAMPEESQELLTELSAHLAKISENEKITTTEISPIVGKAFLLSPQKTTFSDTTSVADKNISTPLPYLVLTTGIGMVQAASALSATLTQFLPQIIICVGSAGGLHPDTRVCDVVIGTEYINSRADATAFGYAPGQIPGNPASLQVCKEIATAIQATVSTVAKKIPEITIRSGQMLSSDAFVTDKNVETTRQLFPNGLTADMESQAYAQVAKNFENTPFVAVRGISDLCGTPEDQSISFHAELAEVASRAAKIALQIMLHFTQTQAQSEK